MFQKKKVHFANQIEGKQKKKEKLPKIRVKMSDSFAK